MSDFKAGDAIVIGYMERKIDGVIELASANGVSLMLGFDALISGHAGRMPVMLGADGIYRSILDDTEVTVTKREVKSNE